MKKVCIKSKLKLYQKFTILILKKNSFQTSMQSYNSNSCCPNIPFALHYKIYQLISFLTQQKRTIEYTQLRLILTTKEELLTWHRIQSISETIMKIIKQPLCKSLNRISTFKVCFDRLVQQEFFSVPQKIFSGNARTVFSRVLTSLYQIYHVCRIFSFFFFLISIKLRREKLKNL